MITGYFNFYKLFNFSQEILSNFIHHLYKLLRIGTDYTFNKALSISDQFNYVRLLQFTQIYSSLYFISASKKSNLHSAHK